MIKVNGADMDWHEGMTVADVLRLKRYTYTKIIIKINNAVIDSSDYTDIKVSDEDDIKVIHLLAGG